MKDKWVEHFTYHASVKLEDCVYVEDCEYCNRPLKSLLRYRARVGLVDK